MKKMKKKQGWESNIWLGMSGTKVNEKENKIIKPKSIFWERKKERENNKTEINKNSLNRNVDRKRSKRTKIVKEMEKRLTNGKIFL